MSSLDKIEQALSEALSGALKVNGFMEDGESKQSSEKSGFTCPEEIVAAMTMKGGDLHGTFQLSIGLDYGELERISAVLELLNQIVGRFSNELYRHGVRLELSPPVVTKQGRFERLNSVSNALCFKVESKELICSLKAVLGPKESLLEMSGSYRKEDVSEEGSLTFFDD